MLIKTILIWSKNYRIMSKSGLHHINIRDKLILLMNCPKQLQEKSDVLSLEIRKSKNKNNNNGILHRLELERCKILCYQEFLRKHAVLMERRTASNPEWNAWIPGQSGLIPEWNARIPGQSGLILEQNA